MGKEKKYEENRPISREIVEAIELGVEDILHGRISTVREGFRIDGTPYKIEKKK